MKELVIISGKGGTGKTSITACFAALARKKTLADCDVDAADLHLVLDPHVVHRESFTGGLKASIDPEKCTACGLCRELCRFDAISEDFVVDAYACDGCGVCADNCPENAAAMERTIAGEWYESETRHGPMTHARLGVAEENSGKLVAHVRTRAKAIAGEKGFNLVVIDGSPGIGCPVIASITGATMVLAVTEPTISGLHDLKRVVALAAHFKIPVSVCVNKYDINPEMTVEIEQWCEENALPVAGRIPFDPIVTKAQMAGAAVVEFSKGSTAIEIERIWSRVWCALECREAEANRDTRDSLKN